MIKENNIDKINFVNLILSGFFNENVNVNGFSKQLYILDMSNIKLYFKLDNKKEEFIINLDDFENIDYTNDFDENLFGVVNSKIIKFIN
jgi:hypothetical protein